jgi:hypothetical protein
MAYRVGSDGKYIDFIFQNLRLKMLFIGVLNGHARSQNEIVENENAYLPNELQSP